GQYGPPGGGPHRYGSTTQGMPSRPPGPGNPMSYPHQQEMVSQYNQQGMGGNPQHRQQGYYNQPPSHYNQQQHQPYPQSHYSQQTPTQYNQQPHMPPAHYSQQPPAGPGKPGPDDPAQHSRPPSLPDLSGKIDDLTMAAAAAMGPAGPAASPSMSPSPHHGPSQSPRPPAVGASPSPHPSVGGPSPVCSPAGSRSSRSGPLSPAGHVGNQMTPQSTGNLSDSGSVSQSPRPQERGYPKGSGTPQGAQYPPQYAGQQGVGGGGGGGGGGPYQSQQGGQYAVQYGQQAGQYGGHAGQFGPQVNASNCMPPGYGGFPDGSSSSDGLSPGGGTGLRGNNTMHIYGPGGYVAPPSGLVPEAKLPAKGKGDKPASDVKSKAGSGSEPPFGSNCSPPTPPPPPPQRFSITVLTYLLLPSTEGSCDLNIAAFPGLLTNGKFHTASSLPHAKLNPPPTPWHTRPPPPLSPPAPVAFPAAQPTIALTMAKSTSSLAFQVFMDSKPTPHFMNGCECDQSGSSTTTGESIMRLYELGPEPERRLWVDRYLGFMEQRGSPVALLPAVGKNPLDLYRLYASAKAYGGFVQVNKKKKWRELSTQLAVGTSSSSASSLKKQYIQFLFAFECKTERGEEPPPEILNPSDNKKTPKIQPPSPAGSSSTQGPLTPQPLEGLSDMKPPTPVSTPRPHVPPAHQNRHVSILLIPVKSCAAPCISRYGGMPSGEPYPGGADPAYQRPYDGYPPRRAFGEMRLPCGVHEPAMTDGWGVCAGAEGYGGGPGDPYSQGPRPHLQYPPSYERRSDQCGTGYMTQGPPPYPPNQPGVFSQQPIAYKRPAEGGYEGPPAKRQETDAVYNQQQQQQQQGQYGSYEPGFPGPDHRAASGPYSQVYGRPVAPTATAQAAGTAGGPLPPGGVAVPQGPGGPVSQEVTQGPVPGVWASRGEPPYPYQARQQGMPGPHGPPYAVPPRSEEMMDQARGPSSMSGSPYPRPTLHHGYHQQPPYPGHGTPASGAYHRSLSPGRSPYVSGMVAPTPPGARMIHRAGHPVPATQLGPSGCLAMPTVRRELCFPARSVEATQPTYKPRRKLTSKEVGSPEAWRVLMSLKSGLLAESAWAVDTVNVLLYDDTSVSSFNLSQLLNGVAVGVCEMYCLALLDIRRHLGETKDAGLGARQTTPRVPVPALITLWLTEFSPAVCMNERVQSPYTIHHLSSRIIYFENPSMAIPVDFSFGGDLTRPTMLTKLSPLPVYIVGGRSRHVLQESNFPRIGMFVQYRAFWSMGGGFCFTYVSSYTCRLYNYCLECHDASRPPGAVENGDSTDARRASAEAVPSAGADGFCDLGLPNGLHSPLDEKLKGAGRLLEDEPECKDDPPLCTFEDWQEALSRRCVCISNTLRSLSFVPGNDAEMSRNPALLAILGRLILLHHRHPERRRGPVASGDPNDHESSERRWWWDCLQSLRENAFVTLANIAGQLDLSTYHESLVFPLLDGLLHWAVCPSAEARDPFPSAGPTSTLSPQRLVLECLSKLSTQDGNVDLMLATPPFGRLRRLCGTLVTLVSERREQVCREMALALLANLAQADGLAARAIALQRGSVPTVLGFLEDCLVALIHQQSPAAMLQHAPPPAVQHPSHDMMRRAATALLAMARAPENRPHFLLQQGRLLDVSMSSMLHPSIAAILGDVLYRVAQA
uniref:AT rich interactive domain 1B (SWI1-like) n=1 Tax=Petromyzon marinus TaxID=7757 RepID=S4RJF0_PETMA